jgi:hypothetical protein
MSAIPEDASPEASSSPESPESPDSDDREAITLSEVRPGPPSSTDTTSRPYGPAHRYSMGSMKLSPLQKFWRRQIALVVHREDCRDHWGMWFVLYWGVKAAKDCVIAW